MLTMELNILVERIKTKLTKHEVEQLSNQFGLHIAKLGLGLFNAERRECHLYDALKLAILDVDFNTSKLKAILRTLMEFYSLTYNTPKLTTPVAKVSDRSKPEKVVRNQCTAKIADPTKPVCDTENDVSDELDDKPLSERVTANLPSDVSTESRTVKAHSISMPAKRTVLKRSVLTDSSDPNTEVDLPVAMETNEYDILRKNLAKNSSAKRAESNQTPCTKRVKDSGCGLTGAEKLDVVMTTRELARNYRINTEGEKKHTEMFKTLGNHVKGALSETIGNINLPCPNGFEPSNCRLCLSYYLCLPVTYDKRNAEYSYRSVPNGSKLRVAHLDGEMPNYRLQTLGQSLAGKAYPSFMSYMIFLTSVKCLTTDVLRDVAYRNVTNSRVIKD